MHARVRLAILLALPLMLVLGAETLFRCGAYESLAKPGSHAGQSIVLKRALADPRLARIDTVTLGDSRAVYGIEHGALAASARARGLVHANLTMPGTAWMTIGVLSSWLAREHPELRGGVIVVAEPGFAYPGNGSYELGIVTPFRSFGDRSWIQAHVPIAKGELASYGTLSALMVYREDVQDLLLHPRTRGEELRWWRAQDAVARMDTAVDERRDLCARPVDTLDECRALLAAPPDPGAPAVAQCRAAVASADAAPGGRALRADYASAMHGELPAHMATLRELIRGQLAELRWRRPPVIVLMPVHALFRDTIDPAGLHGWAREVLRPLAEQGRIVLLDHTDDFITDGRTDCSAFWDFYHQNSVGRARLAERLQPELERALFD